MAAPRRKKSKTLLDEVTELKALPVRLAEGEIPIEEMPLTSLAEHMRYNERARAANKKLGVCRYKAKPCPVELHPTQRIVFGRYDQPTNMLPVFISDSMIDFELKLYPGQTYDLPLYVIDHLADKGTPIYDWFDNADGSRETRMISKTPRFAIRTIYKAE